MPQCRQGKVDRGGGPLHEAWGRVWPDGHYGWRRLCRLRPVLHPHVTLCVLCRAMQPFDGAAVVSAVAIRWVCCTPHIVHSMVPDWQQILYQTHMLKERNQ